MPEGWQKVWANVGALWKSAHVLGRLAQCPGCKSYVPSSELQGHKICEGCREKNNAKTPA